MKFGSHESLDNKVISNMFAEFFASSYASSTFNMYDVFFIDQPTVSKYIQQLKSSYAAGPDGVPSSILKHHSQLCNTLLTYLFKKLFKLFYFPSFWKRSFIIPLFKSGSNYRGKDGILI